MSDDYQSKIELCSYDNNNTDDIIITTGVSTIISSCSFSTSPGSCIHLLSNVQSIVTSCVFGFNDAHAGIKITFENSEFCVLANSTSIGAAITILGGDTNLIRSTDLFLFRGDVGVVINGSSANTIVGCTLRSPGPVIQGINSSPSNIINNNIFNGVGNFCIQISGNGCDDWQIFDNMITTFSSGIIIGNGVTIDGIQIVSNSFTNGNTGIFLGDSITSSSHSIIISGNVFDNSVTTNFTGYTGSLYQNNGIVMMPDNSPSGFLIEDGATKYLECVTTTGSASINTYQNFKLPTLGSKIYIKEGSNASMGRAILVGGTVMVSTTAVTTASEIFLTVAVPGGVVGVPQITAVVNNTSFTITSTSGADTSTISWVILEGF
jgi:hypothetical protein